MPDMRFAPAPVLLGQSASGGLNQTNLRSHNERLILDLLRHGKTLSRFEIGQLSNLSAQTVSVLVRALSDEGLLLKGEAHRGRIGPPTTPFSLNPDGAFAIGVYTGVKVMDICCLDFCGVLRASRRVALAPDDDVVAKAVVQCGELLEEAGSKVRQRCLGIGVALNKAHWPSEPDGSRVERMEAEFTAISGLPCYLLDDVTSAATGEVLFSDHDHGGQFAFVHIGMNTTIRVVLNGQAQKPFDDRLAPLPGLSVLAEQLDAGGFVSAPVWLTGTFPEGAEAIVSKWSAHLTEAVARTLVMLLSVLELRQVIVVAPLQAVFLEDTTAELGRLLGEQGLRIPARVGHNFQYAKASGAASSVLSTRFSPNWQQLET